MSHKLFHAIFFIAMLLQFKSLFAQNSQFTSIGIGIAPNSSIPITVQRGWGDYFQFRRTQNSARWGIHNGQFGENLEFYFTNSAGVSSFNSFVFKAEI